MNLIAEIITVSITVLIGALINLRFALFLGSVDHLPKPPTPPATPTNPQSEIPNPQSHE